MTPLEQMDDSDGRGIDMHQFTEDETFVGSPRPTQPINIGLVNYTGRFSADHVYVTGRFMDKYEA